MLEECIFCGFGWRVLQMFFRNAWSRSEFESWISLLIFCLIDLSNIDSRVVNSPTIVGV